MHTGGLAGEAGMAAPPRGVAWPPWVPVTGLPVSLGLLGAQALRLLLGG